MTLKIKELQKVITLLLARTLEALGRKPALSNSFYWNIPADARYQTEAPYNLDLGLLSDEWEDILVVAREREEALPFALNSVGELLHALRVELSKEGLPQDATAVGKDTGSDSTLRVDLNALERAIFLLLDYVCKTDGEEMELQHDGYWAIPHASLYQPFEKPKGYRRGSLADDWRRLSTLLEYPQRAVPDDLSRAAALLKALSIEVSFFDFPEEGGAASLEQGRRPKPGAATGGKEAKPAAPDKDKK